MRKLVHPKKSDIDTLKKIWCEGFPEDADGYCDFFFERSFSPERTLVVFNGTEIESAVYWFDAYFKDKNGQKQSFIFPFAASTLKNYQGHGNLKYMIEGCMNFTKQSGKTGMVFAAADELVYLYDRWGYKRIAKLHTYSVNVSSDSSDVKWRICPFERFSVLRTALLDSIGNAFYWEGDTEKYMYDDIFTKGHILEASYEGKTHFAVCTNEGDRYIIRETSFPLDKADILIKSISSFYSYSGVMEVYSHSDVWNYSGEYKAEDIYYGHYGLCRGFDGDETLDDSYVNLIAD